MHFQSVQRRHDVCGSLYSKVHETSGTSKPWPSPSGRPLHPRLPLRWPNIQKRSGCLVPRVMPVLVPLPAEPYCSLIMFFSLYFPKATSVYVPRGHVLGHHFYQSRFSSLVRHFVFHNFLSFLYLLVYFSSFICLFVHLPLSIYLFHTLDFLV